MDKIFYGIPTYSQFDRVRSAVDGIYAGSLKPTQIIIIDNSETGAGVLALQDLPKQYPNIHIIPRITNILSGAWNDIMRMTSEDYVILANDDVIPHKHSIEALVTAAKDNPSVAMFNGSGHSGNSYSYFLLRQWAYQIVGPFDERFKPAYFEDNDYDWRLKVAGLIRQEVSTATFEHYGSATIKAMDSNQAKKQHNAFRRNQQYYLSKWGALPGNERYDLPFAGIDLSDL